VILLAKQNVTREISLVFLFRQKLSQSNLR